MASLLLVLMTLMLAIGCLVGLVAFVSSLDPYPPHETLNCPAEAPSSPRPW
jgi:hypothetical protein